MPTDTFELDEEVKSIIDGWFGEAVEDSENEYLLRRALYKPLSDLVKKYKEKANNQA